MTNDLVQYNAAKSQLRPGDLIFYWGTALLSRIIETVDAQGPSHVQIVDRVDLDGTVWIAESTMGKGEPNGVQRHPLTVSILAYPNGSKVGAALLDDETRARADFSALDPYVDSCIGKIAYDVLGLAKFLLPEALREGQINDHNMVCSSFVTSAWEAMRILYGIPYSQASPQLLLAMKLYQAFVPLVGTPVPHNFNTVI